MANKRTDSLCTSIRICISDEINDAVEKYQAKLRIKDNKVRKSEACERMFEMLFRLNGGKI
jgi:hypothetical protein